MYKIVQSGNAEILPNGGYVKTTTTGLPAQIPSDYDDDYEDVIIIKRRKKRRWPWERPVRNPWDDWPLVPEPRPWPDPRPFPPMIPPPFPGVPRCPPQPIYLDPQPCAIEQFFRDNPNGTCMMVCFCPRHRITCS